jgi:hypothetical protein
MTSGDASVAERRATLIYSQLIRAGSDHLSRPSFREGSIELRNLYRTVDYNPEHRKEFTISPVF